MARLLWGCFWFILFCVLVGSVSHCDSAKKKNEHDDLTKGCRLIGDIQSVHTGRGNIPAMEQWDCHGFTRTVERLD